MSINKIADPNKKLMEFYCLNQEIDNRSVKKRIKNIMKIKPSDKKPAGTHFEINRQKPIFRCSFKVHEILTGKLKRKIQDLFDRNLINHSKSKYL